jgi:hypothetical protein
MLPHSRLDDATVMLAEFHASVAHETGRMQGKAVTWLPHHAAGVTPSAIVAGQP